MELYQAILVGTIYGVANMGYGNLYMVLSKPLVCGFLVGLIFGDPATGAILGGTINMIYLGWIGAGASTPADPAAAGCLSTAFVLTTGIDVDTALVLAVPVGLAAISLYTLQMTILSVCVESSNKMIESGKSDRIGLTAVVLPVILRLAIYGIPMIVAAYFGSDAVSFITTFLSGPVMNVISLIGGLLPAVGIAVNLSFIYKKEAKVFLILGFMAAVYLNLNLVAVAVIGFAGAALYYYRVNEGEAV